MINGEADPRLIERVEKSLDEMTQKLNIQRLDPENDEGNDGADGWTGGGMSRRMVWRRNRLPH